MTYADCDFNELGSIAKLYELNMKTARAWSKKSVMPVPWRDPWAVLEWYRIAYGREPGVRVKDRVAILGPQMRRWEEENGVKAREEKGLSQDLPAEQVDQVAVEVLREQTMGGLAERQDLFKELLGDLENAVTLTRIAREEREAYESYQVKKDNGLDFSAEVRRWQDLTKTKREWAKTQDAVEVAMRLLREWLRSEWEVQWKHLRTALDGRRLGMEARELLMAAAADPVEWRRVWDMEMERAIMENLGG